jgi:hypothetical protein
MSSLILVNNIYHEEFNQFVNASTNFFNNFDDYHQELVSLLTQKLKIIHAD